MIVKSFFPCLNLLFVAILVAGLISCKKSTQKADEIEGVSGNNNTDFGHPYKAHFHTYPHDEKTLSFYVVTDTHIDASYAGIDAWCNTSHVKRNRWVIDCINSEHGEWNDKFVIHLGDMDDALQVQNLVSFRQHWENDYPGHDGGAIKGARDTDYNAYSRGHRINLPVYFSLGNHDVPNSPDGWHYAKDYTHDRFKAAPGFDWYEEAASTYIWRAGRYIFFHFGLWAGSAAYESNTKINHKKLDWIKEALARHVPDSTFGLVICQHYGWDYMSTSGHWWSEEMRELEINLLCRRDSSHQPCNPYNVIGIFTGHVHQQGHTKIFAGYDADSNEVYFDNFYFDDAGADEYFGYSHILFYEGDTMMLHYHKNHWGGTIDWHYGGKKIKILD